MIDWPFVLVPLLVLPVVLVFRFIGCSTFGSEGPPGPPRYRDYLMGVSNNPGTLPHPALAGRPGDLVGYWRLTDPLGATAAVDETGARHGVYRNDLSTNAAPPLPGRIAENQPGLVTGDPKAMSRAFTGGYVLVPAGPGLATPEFTIEALVHVPWPPGDKATHRLFTLGGNYDSPSDPGTTVARHGLVVEADDLKLGVRMFPANKQVFQLQPLLPTGATVHVALSVTLQAGGTREARLFIDGKVADVGSVPTYSLPDAVPLIIGAAPDKPDPRVPFESTSPWGGRVQEVVLHRVALSDEEIANHVALNK